MLWCWGGFWTRCVGFLRESWNPRRIFLFTEHWKGKRWVCIKYLINSVSRLQLQRIHFVLCRQQAFGQYWQKCLLNTKKRVFKEKSQTFHLRRFFPWFGTNLSTMFYCLSFSEQFIDIGGYFSKLISSDPSRISSESRRNDNLSIDFSMELENEF